MDIYARLSANLDSLTINNRQGVANLLESLVTYIEREVLDSNQSHRGNQRKRGDPARRVLARHLAEHFQGSFGQRPNTIIATCINIAYPDADPLADEALVRTWTGVR